MNGIIYDSSMARKIISEYLNNIKYSPEVIYKFKKNIISSNSEYVIGSKMKYIIGIEEGGYYAYYISELSKIPCLLINPFFGTFQGNLYGCNIPNDYQNKHFVLNLKHEYCDPLKTLKYRINEIQKPNVIILEETKLPDSRELKAIVHHFLKSEGLFEKNKEK